MATSPVTPMQQATAPMKLPAPAASPAPPSNLMASASAPMSIPGTAAPAPAPATSLVSASPTAAPKFLQDSLPLNKISVKPVDMNDFQGANVTGNNGRPTGGDAYGYVKSDDPYTVHTSDKGFTQSSLNHEMTHMYQDTLPPSVKFAEASKTDPYNYGGVDGLTQAAKSGKKITDFSNEQVAKMVQDHTEKTNMIMQFAKLGVLQPGDVDKYNQWKSAVGPYMTQLAGLNGKSYKAAPAQPGTISDLPEMSDRTQAYTAPSVF